MTLEWFLTFYRAHPLDFGRHPHHEFASHDVDVRYEQLPDPVDQVSYSGGEENAHMPPEDNGVVAAEINR